MFFISIFIAALAPSGLFEDHKAVLVRDRVNGYAGSDISLLMLRVFAKNR